MDFRKVFDLIPEEFDRWRPRYCPEAFEEIITRVGLRPGQRMLEIGPAPGQATELRLKTGCDYTGIELGERLCAVLKRKFAGYENLRVIRGDFCEYDFGEEKFDMVFSAATIQWIPEEVAFSRSFSLLKPGGYLVMIANLSDQNALNPPELLRAKDEVYARYFHPPIPYTQRFNKLNAVLYGFETPEVTDHFYDTELTADQFVSRAMTHADHILLPEPDRTLFTEGLRAAINGHGGVWRERNRVNIVKTRKPEK